VLGGGLNGRGTGQHWTNSASGAANFAVSAPTISLPKGGGLFAVSSKSSPLIRSPIPARCRSRLHTAPAFGLSPSFRLPMILARATAFGFGWLLSVPAIARKSDKGLLRWFVNGSALDIRIKVRVLAALVGGGPRARSGEISLALKACCCSTNDWSLVARHWRLYVSRSKPAA
jgi:hypothetical protein